MITATEHGVEAPQRVRQFFVRHYLEDFLPSPEMFFGDDDAADTGENEGDHSEDLPGFLKYRSLRRRLDSAFESCYQTNMGEWFRSIFRLGA